MACGSKNVSKNCFKIVSEGSRNLAKWWSPRLGNGAVLAASKPLQVSN